MLAPRDPAQGFSSKTTADFGKLWEICVIAWIDPMRPIMRIASSRTRLRTIQTNERAEGHFSRGNVAI